MMHDYENVLKCAHDFLFFVYEMSPLCIYIYICVCVCVDGLEGKWPTPAAALFSWTPTVKKRTERPSRVASGASAAVRPTTTDRKR